MLSISPRIISLMSLLTSVARRTRSLYHLYPPTVQFHKCLRSTSVLAEGAMSSKDCRLVWVDLEMTGLDVTKHYILEMACIITDENLKIVAEGPDIIIHQPDAVLDAMGDWCREHHGKSGLTAACRASTISLADTEEQMVTFVRQHTTQGKCPLAGNTIHMDRRFLDKYMPNFMAHLHYRLVDVSTVKELCRRWYPTEFSRAPVKKLHHRALDDIKESIEELNFYRKAIFQ